jgi:hypothetical protein
LKVIRFLESLADVDIPASNFRVVTSDSAHIAESLRGADKKTAIEAVRLAIGSDLTEADIELIANRAKSRARRWPTR